MTIEFGPLIEWNPAPVTLSDGTFVHPPFPWPGAEGVVVYRDGEDNEFTGLPDVSRFWEHDPKDSLADITHFRLRADHPVYQPKVSRMKRDPDAVFNVYPNRDEWCNRHSRKISANRWALDDRIGMWNAYLKGT